MLLGHCPSVRIRFLSMISCLCFFCFCQSFMERPVEFVLHILISWYLFWVSIVPHVANTNELFCNDLAYRPDTSFDVERYFWKCHDIPLSVVDDLNATLFLLQLPVASHATRHRSLCSARLSSKGRPRRLIRSPFQRRPWRALQREAPRCSV